MHRQERNQVSTCIYANLFEFGWNITDNLIEPGTPPDCKISPARGSDKYGACHEQTRCHSNAILRSKFTDAIVRDWATDELVNPKGCLGTPCAMMDPGVASYHEHLLAMTQTVVDKIPASVGKCQPPTHIYYIFKWAIADVIWCS